MIAEQYHVVIRVDHRDGSTEYHDGTDFGRRLFNPDDEGNGPSVMLYRDFGVASDVVDAWRTEAEKLSPPARDRFRYEVKTLRFALDAP